MFSDGKGSSRDLTIEPRKEKVVDSKVESQNFKTKDPEEYLIQYPHYADKKSEVREQWNRTQKSNQAIMLN